MGDNQRSDRAQIARIRKVVAEKYSLSPVDLKSKTSRDEILFPQKLAIYYACSMTNLSSSKIAKEFGKPNNAAVVAARKSIQRMMKNDPFFVEMANKLVVRIRAR